MKTYELQDGFGIEALKPGERPVPKPGIGQVLVRLAAWSLNYRDLMTVKGGYNPNQRLPLIPLSDGAGEVVEVGAGVTRVKPGDRVTSIFMQDWIEGASSEVKARSALGGALDGMLAEYVALNAEGVVPIPAHLSYEEAATLPCAAVTAWHALVTEGQVKSGDTVLTQGTGGVSLFAVQFARLLGARVIATSSSDEKLQRLRELGASDLINYRSTPAWGDRARELSGGLGVDHVVEVGGAGTLPESFNAVRVGGRISLIGVLAGRGEMNPRPLIAKNLRLQGIFVGSRVMFEQMNAAIALHQLRPVIDRVFAFEEAQAALRHMESGAHFGKIVIAAPRS